MSTLHSLYNGGYITFSAQWVAPHGIYRLLIVQTRTTIAILFHHHG